LSGYAPSAGLLTAQGRHGAATARLLCFSGAGFTAEIRDEAARSAEVRLLTPADLYAGILLQAPPAGVGDRLLSDFDPAAFDPASVNVRLHGPV
jgi:hypothetical protein